MTNFFQTLSSMAEELGNSDHWQPLDMERDPDMFAFNPETGGTGQQDRVLNMLANGCVQDIYKDLQTKANRTSYDIKPNIKKNIARQSDVIGGYYLRLELKRSDADPKQILNLLSSASVDLQIGASAVLTIPSLLINYIILQQLEEHGRDETCGINVVHLPDILQQHTEEELKALVYQADTNNETRKFTRFHVDNPEAYYLDIPLLLDFFSYGNTIPLVALPYHEVALELKMPEEAAVQLEKYAKWCYLDVDHQIYHQTGVRRDLTQAEHSYYTTNCRRELHALSPEERITVKGASFTKFLMVLIRSHSVDPVDLPEILTVTLSHETTAIELDTSMFYVADYNSGVRLYVISPNDADMSDWCALSTEFSAQHGMDNDLTTGALKFPVVRVDHFNIQFKDWSPDITVETYLIWQNQMRIMFGMGANSFSL